MLFHANSEESDQTAQMRRLIGVLDEYSCEFVGLPCSAFSLITLCHQCLVVHKVV